MLDILLGIVILIFGMSFGASIRTHSTIKDIKELNQICRGDLVFESSASAKEVFVDCKNDEAGKEVLNNIKWLNNGEGYEVKK